MKFSCVFQCNHLTFLQFNDADHPPTSGRDAAAKTLTAIQKKLDLSEKFITELQSPVGERVGK
jgi:hypothetical protein